MACQPPSLTEPGVSSPTFIAEEVDWRRGQASRKKGSRARTASRFMGADCNCAPACAFAHERALSAVSPRCRLSARCGARGRFLTLIVKRPPETRKRHLPTIPPPPPSNPPTPPHPTQPPANPHG